MAQTLAPALALAVASAPALASEPARAGDTPVVTAPSATNPPASPASESVAEQIDAYLKSSPALEIDHPGTISGVVPRGDRKIHGEVTVGVGTGGYRSVYARADMPVGDSGRVSIAVQDSRGRYGHNWAGGLDRQRCDLESLTPPRHLDMLGGPHGRCVGMTPFR